MLTEKSEPMSKGAANALAMSKIYSGKWAEVKPLKKTGGNPRKYIAVYEVTEDDE
jgi:hypothetical protein